MKVAAVAAVLVGSVLVVAGVGMFNVPAALVVAGLYLMGFGLLVDVGDDR